MLILKSVLDLLKNNWLGWLKLPPIKSYLVIAVNVFGNFVRSYQDASHNNDGLGEWTISQEMTFLVKRCKTWYSEILLRHLPFLARLGLSFCHGGSPWAEKSFNRKKEIVSRMIDAWKWRMKLLFYLHKMMVICMFLKCVIISNSDLLCQVEMWWQQEGVVTLQVRKIPIYPKMSKSLFGFLNIFASYTVYVSYIILLPPTATGSVSALLLP